MNYLENKFSSKTQEKQDDWNKVLSCCELDEFGCLVWKGYAEKGTRPMFKKNTSVRRFVYELTSNITGKNFAVFAKCLDPLCVHPDHLVELPGRSGPKFELNQENAADPIVQKQKFYIWNRLLNSSQQKDDCIEWNGKTMNFSFDGKTTVVTRVAWGLHNNQFPVPFQNACDDQLIRLQQSCENDKCIEPSHIDKIVCQKSNNELVYHDSITVEMKDKYVTDEKKNKAWKRILTQCQVLDNGCWQWTGHSDLRNGGYAKTSYLCKTIKVHRLSYIFANGKIATGLFVRHMCNNRLCFNPEHLEKGDALDNHNDHKISLNRHVGERVSAATITEGKAKEIYNSKANGTQQERAQRFNVPISRVRDIDCGRAWGHATNHVNEKKTEKLDQMRRKRKIPLTLDEIHIIADRIRKKLKKDEKSDCENYQGGKNQNGYGKISYYGKSCYTHDIILQDHSRQKRPELLETRHLCHNPSCCNVNHLAWGTHSDNMIDTVKDGRSRSCKLNDIQVRGIKEELAKDNSAQNKKKLAEKFSISVSNINNISRNTIWKHVYQTD